MHRVIFVAMRGEKMRLSLMLGCFIVVTLTGCSTAKYAIVESEFSYENSGGVSKYFSKKPLKINLETGESYIMDYSNANSYYWRPVNEMDAQASGKIDLNF